MKELKLNLVHLLFTMYQDQEEDVMNYDCVDEFYATIGYELESEKLLNALNINGTSDLQDTFINYSLYLNNQISELKFYQLLEDGK